MPSRRNPDVLPLVEPKPPAEHPLADLDPGAARKGRRRRSPGPEIPDLRDEFAIQLLRRVQDLDAQLGALADRFQIALVQIELLRRKVLALETAAQARQGPAGAVHAPEADRSDVPTSQTP
jgi:hypothetical protein